jgi:hypothetical protein
VLRLGFVGLRIPECSNIDRTNLNSDPMAINAVKCGALPDVVGLSLIRHWRLKLKGVCGGKRYWILRNSPYGSQNAGGGPKPSGWLRSHLDAFSSLCETWRAPKLATVAARRGRLSSRGEADQRVSDTPVVAISGLIRQTVDFSCRNLAGCDIATAGRSWVE